MKKLVKIIPTGSVVLSVLSLFSYILGLVRDRFFAQTFGASRELDAYNAAFLFPDLVFNVLIAGGIAAAFVPILTELLHSDEKKARDYVNSVLTTATSTMLVSALGIVIFADTISFLVAPGFDSESRLLVTKILRILAFSPIFFAASNAIGGILITKRRFLFYGLSPILYNIGIIFGTIFLVPYFGVMGVAIGTLVGSVLHLSARIWDVWAEGFRFRTSFAIRTPEFRKTIRLMIPKMFGHPIELATFWGFTAIASTLSPGSITILNFARNFQSVPISLIGITLATTSFPLLSHAMNERARDAFWLTLKHTFFLILSTSLLTAVFIFLIRDLLVGLFLGGGEFRADDVMKTASVLGVFCLSIPTEALSHLLARAFYATKNTTVPVALSFVGFAIALPGAYFLSPSLGILALPFAFFLGSLSKLIALGCILPLRVRKILD